MRLSLAMMVQIALMASVLLVAGLLIHTTLGNLHSRGISTGFGFLERPAGFDIGESLIAYTPSDSYGRALLVGALNTLKVAAITIVLASFLGLGLGLARLSENWLLRQLATAWVEVVRNTPLLLQLFFWYALITEVLPHPRAALSVADLVYISNRGLKITLFEWQPAFTIALLIGVVGFTMRWMWCSASAKLDNPTPPPMALSSGVIIAIVAVFVMVMSDPLVVDAPTFTRFNFVGGGTISPEFTALLVGLTLYSAGFIAEIVRSGILSVPRGQREAALSLGLSPSRTMRLVILPQALRLMIPPMTSQFLNIAKNSSLAVAIGYPDLVAIANITINQTGQAIEGIAIIMAAYLTISLSLAALMNAYNKATDYATR